MSTEKQISAYTVVVPEGSEVVRRNGTIDQEKGSPITYDFNVQNCFVDVGDAFPHPFTLRLDAGQPPYLAGKYRLVNFLEVRNGKLIVSKTPKLAPIQAPAKPQ